MSADLSLRVDLPYFLSTIERSKAEFAVDNIYIFCVTNTSKGKAFLLHLAEHMKTPIRCLQYVVSIPIFFFGSLR